MFNMGWIFEIGNTDKMWGNLHILKFLMRVEWRKQIYKYISTYMLRTVEKFCVFSFCWVISKFIDR